MLIEVNNLTSFKIEKDLFSEIAKDILSKEKKELVELSIVFVKERVIKKINKEYRKKNKSTNVLSFIYGDIAEIVICPRVVKKNAKEYKVTFFEELLKVFIHGLLHITGLDHEESEKVADLMQLKQNEYLKLWLK